MKDTEIRVEVISGSGGQSLSIWASPTSGYRVAGPKPWGGGHATESWTLDRERFLKDVSRALGVQFIESEDGRWVR